jgi:hypothetical protein
MFAPRSARLPPAELPAAWCRRGLWFKTVACNPPASLAAYRRAQHLLPAAAPAELRTQVLVGLAWPGLAWPGTKPREAIPPTPNGPWPR